MLSRLEQACSFSGSWVLGLRVEGFRIRNVAFKAFVSFLVQGFGFGDFWGLELCAFRLSQLQAFGCLHGSVKHSFRLSRCCLIATGHYCFYFLADAALCLELGKKAQLNGTTKANILIYSQSTWMSQALVD